MRQGPVLRVTHLRPWTAHGLIQAQWDGFRLVLPRAGKREGDERRWLAARGQRTSRRGLTRILTGVKGTPHSGLPAFRWTRRTNYLQMLYFSSTSLCHLTCDTTEHLHHNWLSTLFGLGLGPSLFQLLHDWVLKTPTTNVMKTVQLQQCWS